jgi:hypothetical protein
MIRTSQNAMCAIGATLLCALCLTLSLSTQSTDAVVCSTSNVRIPRSLREFSVSISNSDVEHARNQGGDDDDKGGDPDAYVPQGRFTNMNILNGGDDDDKGGDPDAYVPQGRSNKMSIRSQGDDDDKGGDPDAYVPQGRTSTNSRGVYVRSRGDDDDKVGDPDAYVPQGRFSRISRHVNVRGDDDDKGGDPDAYVPQGRFSSKVLQAAMCLHIRGGAGHKGAKVTNSTTSKAKVGSDKAKSSKGK